MTVEIYKNNKPVLKISPGDVFGDLTVIEIAESYKTVWKGKTSSKERWLCRCICGNNAIKIATRLRKKRDTKCTECAYKSRPQSKRRKPYYERLFDLRVLNNAKKRGIIVTLTLDEYIYLSKQPCYYCHKEPILVEYIGDTKYTKRDYQKVNGIDRIDSKLGYLFNNCIPCCKNCNIMKMELTQKEFADHIELLYNTFVKQKDDR